MKRLTAVVAALAAILYLGVIPAAAQRSRGPGGGGPPSGPMGGSSHASTSSRGGSGSSHGTGASSASNSSPSEVLGRNSTLNTKLSTNLQNKGLLPQGTDLKTACQGFRTLGQCIAAIHVSHNLNIPFACFQSAMADAALPTGTGAPSCTGLSAPGKMTLGKTIQTLSPNTTGTSAKSAAKKGTKEANDDIKQSSSGS